MIPHWFLKVLGKLISPLNVIDEKLKSPLKDKTTQESRKRAKSVDKNDEQEQSPKKNDCDDELAEKKRADALWADFLGDEADLAEDKPPAKKVAKIEAKPQSPLATPVPDKKKVEPIIVKEIFEYAGEEVVVEKLLEQPTQSASSSKPAVPSKAGGLGSILGALNKKNKISTLEKTKLDWDRFKNQEGIAEDLNTFNRGKDGYLERQDFLQRTDVRQFEREKAMRQTSRSNR